MAKVASETNNKWLDVKPTDFSERVQSLLAQERAAYEVLKAAKAAVLAQVKAETPMPAGMEIKGTVYTRWGQWQIVVGEIAAPKPVSQQRGTLADFIAAQSAAGRAV